MRNLSPPHTTKELLSKQADMHNMSKLFQSRDITQPRRHQKRSNLSSRQYRYQPGFQKDPNFEFSSNWNASDYYDNIEASVTEMTDEKFLELGFPVHPSVLPEVHEDHPRLDRMPPSTVIDNPFFHIVSRKYKYSLEVLELLLMNNKYLAVYFHEFFPRSPGD